MPQKRQAMAEDLDAAKIFLKAPDDGRAHHEREHAVDVEPDRVVIKLGLRHCYPDPFVGIFYYLRKVDISN